MKKMEILEVQVRRVLALYATAKLTGTASGAGIGAAPTSLRPKVPITSGTSTLIVESMVSVVTLRGK
jgi:hypothetical protein